jgi:hypothetical protein
MQYSLGCYTYSLIALRPKLNMNTNLKRIAKKSESTKSLQSFLITSVLSLFMCITIRQSICRLLSLTKGAFIIPL